MLLIQASIQKECIKFNYMNHKQTWKIRTRRTHARKLETFCVLLSCLMCDCSFIFFSEYFVQHDSAGESLLVSSKNIEKNSHEFCAELLQQKVNCTIFWPRSLSRYICIQSYTNSFQMRFLQNVQLELYSVGLQMSSKFIF